MRRGAPPRTALTPWLGGLALCALLGLPGCIGLPPPPAPPSASLTRVAPPEAPLARLAREAGIPEGRTGARPLQMSAYALDARLTLMRQARVSIDLQTYLIADDATGRLMLRELRDAAARGVRVRLLLDDFYTDGMTELLLGLAATPGVEVRLFNPFAYGRDWPLAKAWNLLTDFRRLNRRMHNKLLVADGVAAIVGGRNIADEYFFRSHEGNFIDFEVLAVGALVPQLGGFFDEYWNSEQVRPLQAVATSDLTVPERQALFERLTDLRSTPSPAPPAQPDAFGVAPLSSTLGSGHHGLRVVDAGCYADPPAKAAGTLDPTVPTVMSRFIDLMHEARSNIVLYSPYFVPGPRGVKMLAEARQRGIDVVVVTNALAASDEPLVSQGYGKYREALLGVGVQLFEISSERLQRDREVGRLLGSSTGRLHAKVAFVDRRMLLLGSMNLDPRSERTNTELGVSLRGAEFVAEAAQALRVDRPVGVFQVRLKPGGGGVEWVGSDSGGDETLGEEPEAGLWQRVKLKFFGLFVPEDLL